MQQYISEKKIRPWALQITVPEKKLTKKALTTLIVTMLIGIAGFIAMFTVLLLTLRSAVRPIIESNKFVKQISEGDLSAHILNHGTGEIGELTRNLKKMKERLVVMILSLKNIAVTVKDTGTAISDKLVNLKSDSELQAGSSQKIASTITEMAENIEKNSYFAQKTTQIAKKSVIKLTGAVKKVNATKNKLSSIVEKIELVDDVAFQTKILSLNSAIEAAHAGQYGKEFAVVAKDVRKLAEKTKQISKQVQSLSKEGVEKATNSSNSISNIVLELKKITEMIDKVAKEVSRQTGNSKLVEDSMTNLNKTIQNNLRFATQMTEKSQILKTTSNELVKAVSVFKLK